MDVRVITHIDKPDRYSPHEAIRRVSGPGWGILTLAQAVAWAKIPGNKFVVRNIMSTVDVKVMRPKGIFGDEYLQTVADNTTTDNLLSLPQILTVGGLFGGLGNY